MTLGSEQTATLRSNRAFAEEASVAGSDGAKLVEDGRDGWRGGGQWWTCWPRRHPGNLSPGVQHHGLVQGVHLLHLDPAHRLRILPLPGHGGGAGGGGGRGKGQVMPIY